ncbi:MAG: hypothetical protein HY290_28325 [Planctomycetia bacterium]|nr:hypothetical protein [Planctomycetia bacterium]
MSKFKMLRWLLGAGVLSLAAVVFGGGAGSIGEEPPKEPEPTLTAIPQPAEAPLDRPIVDYVPRGWQDIQDPVLVEFSGLSKSGSQLTGDVKLLNRGGTDLKGPVRIVIDDLCLEGISLKNASGKLENKAHYVDVLAKGKILKAHKLSAPRKLTFSAKVEPAAEKLEKFSPRYRVLVPADPADLNANAGMSSFTQEQLDSAMKAQNKLDDQLREAGYKDIHGSGTGVDEDGNLYIAVYARIPNPDNVPKTMDGLPVKVELKGPFFPLYEDVSPYQYDDIKTDSRFARPVPTGVGIGNEKGCNWVGTLGARVTYGGQRCLLSNYHVLIGDATTITAWRIMQPAGCQNVSAANSLGNLRAYFPITFSKSANNRYDAAIATTSTSLVKTLPPAGYSSLGGPRAPAKNLAVQKFGRTTRFTRGTISQTGVTINVGYGRGPAKFINLFEVKPQPGFSAFGLGGDSGSLVVTQGTNQPVGLLMAGDGGTVYCCPIADMLSASGMTIDR